MAGDQVYQEECLLSDFHPDLYEHVGELASGAQGYVSKSIRKPSSNKNLPKYVALKNISIKEANEADQLREYKILKQCQQHPNILQLYYWKIMKDPTDFKHLHLYTELCDCNLKTYLHGRNLSIAKIRLLCQQMLEGCIYLHSKNIVHRDIKPTNILVNHIKRDESNIEVKLADFGLARLMPSKVSSSFENSIVGTRDYAAPEIISAILNQHKLVKPKRPFAVDIFSLGVVIFEMLVKERPFTVEQLGRPTSPDVNNIVQRKIGHPDIAECLSEMLKWDPKQRPPLDCNCIRYFVEHEELASKRARICTNETDSNGALPEVEPSCDGLEMEKKYEVEIRTSLRTRRDKKRMRMHRDTMVSKVLTPKVCTLREAFTTDDGVYIRRFTSSIFNFRQKEIIEFYAQQMKESTCNVSISRRQCYRLEQKYMIFKLIEFSSKVSDMTDISAQDRSKLVACNYPIAKMFCDTVYTGAAGERYSEQYRSKIKSLSMESEGVRCVESRLDELFMGNAKKNVDFDHVFHKEKVIRLMKNIQDWPKNEKTGEIDEILMNHMLVIIMLSQTFVGLDKTEHVAKIQMKYKGMMDRYLKWKHEGVCATKSNAAMDVVFMCRELMELVRTCMRDCLAMDDDVMLTEI